MNDLSRVHAHARVPTAGKERIKEGYKEGGVEETIKGTIKENHGGLEIPISLSTVEFLEAWKEWVEYRTEAGKKYRWVTTSRVFKKSLQKCQEWGIERSIAAIDLSIEMGWRGLFESQYQKPANSNPANGELVDAQGFICDATCLGGPPRRRRDAQGNYVRAEGHR